MAAGRRRPFHRRWGGVEAALPWRESGNLGVLCTALSVTADDKTVKTETAHRDPVLTVSETPPPQPPNAEIGPCDELRLLDGRLLMADLWRRIQDTGRATGSALLLLFLYLWGQKRK